MEDILKKSQNKFDRSDYKSVDEVLSAVDQKITEMIVNGEIKRVESNEEYWKAHKICKKKMNKLFMKTFKHMFKPMNYIYEFELIMAEIEVTGVQNEEWTQKQRERLYKEMQSPYEFKAWIDETKERMLKKGKDIINRNNHK